MRSNEELQKNVVDAINWEPLLQSAEIGVKADNGVITLTGAVNTYIKKSEAEPAAKHVAARGTPSRNCKSFQVALGYSRE